MRVPTLAGSNPPGVMAFLQITLLVAKRINQISMPPWSNWLGQSPSKRYGTGSSPVGGAFVDLSLKAAATVYRWKSCRPLNSPDQSATLRTWKQRVRFPQRVLYDG